MKIAVIYNDNIRKDTTGSYCYKAIKGIENLAVDHLQPFEIKDGYDFYIVIDDGVRFDWSPLRGKKVAYWAIDTHLGFDERYENAVKCSNVFVAQKNDAEKFIKRGVNAVWLPLGCDPETHTGSQLYEKKYDVCFVGHTDPKFMGKRIEYLDALFKAFPNFFYGQRFFEEASKIYAQSRIVFNCSVKNDVNMRCFEATASGSLLLMDRITDNGFEEIFKDGTQAVTYTGIEEMLEKAKYYLDNDKEREAIARAGQEISLNCHTYKNRMFKLLGECGIGGLHGKGTQTF